MSRVRDESKWNFTHHSSVSEFLTSPRDSGAHAIAIGEQYLDILIENRQSKTTIVVFQAAVPLKITTYPVFMGRELARHAGINLISVTDPSISISGLHLGWHLGNRSTGPLKQVLVSVLRHANKALGADRVIFFGASGGGYVAAHLAPEFPGSIALLINPRLTFRAMSGKQLESYFRLCHGREAITKLTPESEQYLKPYGPISIAETIENTINHHIAIYQNLGDKEFLNSQTLPFFDEINQTENVTLRLNADDYGHKPIPRELIRQIVHNINVSNDPREGLYISGFDKPDNEIKRAIKLFPGVMKNLQDTAEQNTDLKKKAARLRRIAKTAQSGLAETSSQVDILNQTCEDLADQLRTVRSELISARTLQESLNRQAEKLLLENRRLTNSSSRLHEALDESTIVKLFRKLPDPVKRTVHRILKF